MTTSAKRAKPVSEATRALLDEMREDAKPSEDKLDQLKKGVAKLRDLEFEKTTLSDRLKDVGQDIEHMKSATLVDLFDNAGVNIVGIEADGNLPAYECEIGDYYHANIPDEQQDAAYAHLRKIGQEDLIKTTYTIAFGLREAKAAERFKRSLDKAGIKYSVKSGVPWNTLTAWFKVEHKRKPLPAKVMDLLGARVGRVVKVVKQKEKK
jgi:hypothetical protein